MDAGLRSGCVGTTYNLGRCLWSIKIQRMLMTDKCTLREIKHLHSKNYPQIKICRGCFDESVPQYPDESVPQLSSVPGLSLC